jgi:hypothetical protein
LKAYQTHAQFKVSIILLIVIFCGLLMSNVPKNKANSLVLNRDGPADYTKLSSAAFPTPQADEVGAILEETDTGTRYRWSSTNWISISTGGALIVSDFFLEMAKGNIPGHAGRAVVGRNPAVGLSVEDVWDPGGVLIYPTAGEQLEISSTDVNDTSAGTGARTVKLFYQDDNYVRKEEIITLNGLSVVTTTATNIFRTEAMEVMTIGIGAENAGQLNLTVVSAGAARGAILVGENFTKDSHYTVPAGKTAFIRNLFEEINKNEDVVLEYKATRGANGIFRTALKSAIYQSNVNIPIFFTQNTLVEKTDIKVTAISTNAAAAPSVFLQIIEVDN